MTNTADRRDPFTKASVLFCKAFLLFYFAAFSVVPLAHLHVESSGNEIVTLVQNSDSKRAGFMFVLHELLFVHFKDHTDYTLARLNSSFQADGDPKPSANNDISKFASLINQVGEGYSAPAENSVRHLFIPGGGPRSFGGFRPFSSGLSPPSA